MQESRSTVELTCARQVCFTIVANALRGDRELLLEVSTHGSGGVNSDERDKEAFSVLIDSATRLSTKLPYIGVCSLAYAWKNAPDVYCQRMHCRRCTTLPQISPQATSQTAAQTNRYRLLCSVLAWIEPGLWPGWACMYSHVITTICHCISRSCKPPFSVPRACDTISILATALPMP